MENLHDNDPRSIGDFKLLGRLGAGGFGVVYAAEDADGSPFALKVLRPELADDAGLRERLGREGDLLRRVSGTRTVKIFDVVTEGPHAYLVMERLEGKSLDKIVNDSGPLKGPMLWFATEALFEALDDIHNAGIVHRDLKPSNIILGPDGLKVLDFGVSVVADQTSLTRTGALVGTAAWISPEQINGDPVTPASDVFNAGLVLAYAATGRHPFGEGRSDAVMYRIAHQEPNLSAVAEPLRSAVEACLLTAAGERPTVAAVRRFLSADGSVSFADLARSPGVAAHPAESRTGDGATRQVLASGHLDIGPKSVDRTVIIGDPLSVHAEPLQLPSHQKDGDSVGERQARRPRRTAAIAVGVIVAVTGVTAAVAWTTTSTQDTFEEPPTSTPAERSAGTEPTDPEPIDSTDSTMRGDSTPSSGATTTSAAAAAGGGTTTRIDRDPPTISNIQVSATTIEAGAEFTVTWTASDPSGLDASRTYVELTGLGWVDGCPAPFRIAGNQQSMTLRLNCRVGGWGDGAHRLNIVVTDTLGNKASGAFDTPISVVRQGPRLVRSEFASSVRSDASLDVYLELYDPSGLASVRVTTDGLGVTCRYDGPVWDGYVDASWARFTCTFESYAAPGTYSVFWQAADEFSATTGPAQIGTFELVPVPTGG